MRPRYKQYVAAHGNTTSGKLVAEYLEVLKANGYRRAGPVVDFIRKHGGH